MSDTLATKAEIAEAIADRDYWESFLPERWSLIGFSWRQEATIMPPMGRCLEVTADHLPLLKQIIIAKDLRAENERLREAQAIVDAQAEDNLLWSRPVVGLQSIQEAYLQKELRRLHEAIEGKTAEECAREALKEPDDA